MQNNSPETKTAPLKAAKCVRVLTLAPIMAFLLLTIFFISDKTGEIFRGWWDFAAAAAFLVVMPLLAYPCQPLFPRFRDAGRSGQRALAIIFAVVGYIAGAVFAAATGASRTLLMI